MDGTTHETGRSASSPSLAKRTGKVLAVRVQMLDDTITMFQIQVSEKEEERARHKQRKETPSQSVLGFPTIMCLDRNTNMCKNNGGKKEASPEEAEGQGPTPGHEGWNRDGRKKKRTGFFFIFEFYFPSSLSFLPLNFFLMSYPDCVCGRTIECCKNYPIKISLSSHAQYGLLLSRSP